MHGLICFAATNDKEQNFALPGFNEYLLGYKDRSAVLDAAHAEKVGPVGNGVFAATIVMDGRVAWWATGNGSSKKTGIDFSATPFTHLSPADAQRFATAVQRYGALHKLSVRVV